MKKACLLLLLGVFAFALTAQPAWALPAFCKQFLQSYKESKIGEAAAEAKCNVCHYGKSKKNRNDFGVALSKFATKATYTELKKDPDKLKAALEEAFKKVEAEKSVGGDSFGELIKSGKLPGTAPEEE